MILAGRAMPDSVGEVIIEVARKHGLPAAQVLGDSRRRPYFVARREAMIELDGRGFSSPMIGNWFGRNHTTVLAALRRTRRALPNWEAPWRREQSGMMIELPWPPASLSGHAKGASMYHHAAVTKRHRELAAKATQASGAKITWDGDVRAVVTFYPPDRRGDRVNYPNRMKPAWDGIADALGINDRRFLPVFQFAEPVEHPRIVVVIDGPVRG